MWNGSQLKSSQEEFTIGEDKTAVSTAGKLPVSTADKLPVSVMSAKQKSNDNDMVNLDRSEEKDCECINSGTLSIFCSGFSFQKCVIFISVSLLTLLVTASL